MKGNLKAMGSDNLKKALHKAILKAYQNGKEDARVAQRSQTIDAIAGDINDLNAKPSVPKSKIPASAEPVLNKESPKEQIHQQKQANMAAHMGQRPGSPQINGESGMKPLKAFMQKKESKRQQTSPDQNVDAEAKEGNKIKV